MSLPQLEEACHSLNALIYVLRFQYLQHLLTDLHVFLHVILFLKKQNNTVVTNFITPQSKHFICGTSHRHPVFELYIVSLMVWAKFVRLALCFSTRQMSFMWPLVILFVSSLGTSWQIWARPVCGVHFSNEADANAISGFIDCTFKTIKWDISLPL